MEIQMHFVMLMSVILLLVSFNKAMDHCLPGQRDLLLKMRNSLTYDPFLSMKLANWDEAVDCCRWKGVQCDNGGRVIGLDLSSDFISGTVDDSSSLFGLRFLRRLSLADNFFDYSSPLPAGFGQLTQLRYLNLSETNFGGQIPIELSRLSRLVTLDLSTNHQLLKLEDPNLKIFLQNFSDLRELRLDGVDMGARGYDWCQALSSSLPHLQFLSCSSCNISGPLDSSLAKLQALSVIRLDGNPLFSPFPEFLADFPNLTVLSLSSSSLFEETPQRIFQISTLKMIDLSNNRELGGSLPEFPHNASLEQLDLSLNKFSGNLLESIGNLRMLSTLNLANCNFSGTIPSSISNLSRLFYLNFMGNNFTGSLPTFSQSKSLTTINLASNKLTGKIPQEWEGLQNLQQLDLSYNSLGGSLPPFLLTLPSLYSLSLSNNGFSGQISVLEGVSPAPFTGIDLSSNHLEGPFPEFLFKTLGLVDLDLSSNKLSGPVELMNFSKLVNLTALQLSYNNLSLGAGGSDADFSSLLPQFSTLMLASCKLQKFPFLKNQSRLFMLDLSANQITGEIPNWVWELNSMAIPFVNLSHNAFTGLQEPYSFGLHLYLDLHSNLLTGKIPLPPRSAVFVDFSSNKFASPIPVDIGNHLSSAVLFSIADNGVVGDIPQSFCNSSLVEVLDLSGNNLSGSIPTCLTELSKLSVLNLRQNKLRGNLPTSFPLNCGLETLDLSYNLLEGPVPESLMNCSSLKVLNIGNNKIKSLFPCWSKNLSNLRVLILHSNNFHGEIICQDNRNHSSCWQNLQIIDIANNNFHGVLPPQFFSEFTGMVGDSHNGSSLQLDHLHYKRWVDKVYYQDSVSMNYKGNPLQVVKILSAFTSIDVSSNSFQGKIPETIGKLRSLLLLNLSTNAFTTQIPPFLGKMKHL